MYDSCFTLFSRSPYLVVPTIIFHGGYRGFSKVLLGPAIPYHSMPCGQPTPASLTATRGLDAHKTNLVFLSLDITWTPGNTLEDMRPHLHSISRCSEIIGNLAKLELAQNSIFFDKKGQELNQMFIISHVMLLGSFLFIFVIMLHALLCLATLYFFLIIKPLLSF
jgi:hypothetical protein